MLRCMGSGRRADLGISPRPAGRKVQEGARRAAVSGGGAVSEKIPGNASGGVPCGILPDAFALADRIGTVYVPNNGNDSRHIAMLDDEYAERRV